MLEFDQCFGFDFLPPNGENFIDGTIPDHFTHHRFRGIAQGDARFAHRKQIVGGFDFDSGQFFDAQNLGTRAARYRVQGVRSTQCKDSQAVGVIAVQSSVFNNVEVGTTLTNAGKFSGRIVWDPAGAVPEGGIR